MKIFITGGTGFIGRHAVGKLLSGGHEICLLTGKSGASVFAGENIQFIEGGLGNTRAWSGKLKKWNPEAVLHLAWEGIPDYGAEASAKNLKYGLNLLNAIGDTGCKALISAGSCWEYGDVSGKVGESFPEAPKNAFAAAKTAFHLFAGNWAKEKGMKFFGLRLFFVYGPGQKRASLIPHVISSARSWAQAEIKNPNGGNDFVFVGDAVGAFSKMIEKYSEAESGIYNVGSGSITGIASAVNEVYRYYGLPPLPECASPTGFYADISKIRKAIGWSPQTSVSDGIKKMIENY